MSAIVEAVKLLAEPSWENVIKRPLSGEAAQILADIVIEKKPLTRSVMDKHRTAVTELITQGCMTIDLRKTGRSEKIEGALKPKAIVALADEMLERIEVWREQL